MPTEVSRKLFTVAEYHQMGKAGILRENDRVELIEGEIVEITAIGYRHWMCVNLANSRFSKALDGRAIVSIQNSATLSEWSEPEPDLAVFKWRDDFYAGKRIGPEDVLLILEAADSSLNYDLKVKVPLYAKAGIPEFWIENLRDDVIHVYRDPEGTAYKTTFTLGRGDSISLVAFPDVTFRVADLLGQIPTVGD